MLRFAKRAMTTAASSEVGPIQKLMTDRVNGSLSPQHVEIFNDSHKHTHHQAMRGATNTVESHFRMQIVSAAFEGKTQPARHRMVYSLLQDEMSRENGIHALQLSTKTPAEWAKANQ